MQLEQRLKTNFSLTSLNLQENNITDIVTLVSSLALSSQTGSLKYLNLKNNNVDFSKEINVKAFCDFLKESRNLQVLRLHKMFKIQSEVAQDEPIRQLTETIVSALEESESRLTLRAIEMDLPTEMSWKTAEKFEACMPQLESLDLYCLSFVHPEDRI